MTANSNLEGKNKLAFKLIALFSNIRWYNILLTVLAQYLSAYVIISHSGGNYWQLIYDFKLHAIVLASVFSIAAGFIVNNFYDFEKDLINRPKVTLFNTLISKNTTLNIYLIFNIIAVLIALIASFKICIFFLIFIFSFWFYSHKIQKIPFIKEFAASILSVTSFFAIILHYAKFYPFIFVYGVFFMSLVYSRELVKQFQNYKGDMALNNSSIPVLLGFDKARYFNIFILMLSFFFGFSILVFFGFSIGNYFLIIALVSIFTNLFLLKYNHFRTVNLVYKILIVLGIFNLLLI